jgi:hypothetical protein
MPVSFFSHPAFLPGSHVDIAKRDVLEQYALPIWGRTALSEEQLRHAEQNALITRVISWADFSPRYRLEGIPGWWHEPCLVDPYFLSRVGYLRPEDVFLIGTEIIESREFVTIREKDGLLCLAIRPPADLEEWAGLIKQVAQIRHIIGFEERYGITSEYVRKKFGSGKA